MAEQEPATVEVAQLPVGDITQEINYIAEHIGSQEPQDKGSAFWHLGRLYGHLSGMARDPSEAHLFYLHAELMRAHAEHEYAAIGCAIWGDKSGNLVTYMGFDTIEKLLDKAEKNKSRLIEEIQQSDRL